MVEVIPINYIMKSNLEQQSIIDKFYSVFKNTPCKMQIFAKGTRADISDYVGLLHDEYTTETNENCRNMIMDHMQFVQEKSLFNSVSIRYFLVIQYSSDLAQIRNPDYAHVVARLNETLGQIQSTLASMGIRVRHDTTQESDEEILQYLHTVICNAQNARGYKATIRDEWVINKERMLKQQELQPYMTFEEYQEIELGDSSDLQDDLLSKKVAEIEARYKKKQKPHLKILAVATVAVIFISAIILLAVQIGKVKDITNDGRNINETTTSQSVSQSETSGTNSVETTTTVEVTKPAVTTESIALVTTTTVSNFIPPDDREENESESTHSTPVITTSVQTSGTTEAPTIDGTAIELD